MNHILQLLLLLSAIIFAAKLGGALSTKIGQPAIFGKILIGLILGPSLLNILGWPVFAPSPMGAHFVSLSLKGIIHDLAQIGVILLMFIAGMETNLAGVKKVGKVAFWAAAGGVLLPMSIGAWASRYFGYSWTEAIFIGTILTATSVSITAQTLLELNALKSKEGSCILGAAVIDDVMGIIALSLVVAFTLNPVAHSGLTSGITSTIFLIVQIGLFFLLSIFIGRRYFEKTIKWATNIPGSQMLLASALVICFLYAFWAEYFGKVAAITGAYIAGVLLAQTSFKEKILKEAQIFSYPLFIPVFLIDIGLQANARQLSSEITFTIIIIVIAVLGKILGCGLGAKLTGFNFAESTRVGIGMISRGEVGLIVASYGLSHMVIGEDIFSSMVLMVLATTLVTPLLLRFVFPNQKLKT